jgi:acetyltransferase-like isoleucine patch superfamily enzyme
VTGAGAVVKHDVPAGGVAVGMPARVIRRVAPDEAPVPEPTP